MGYDPVDEFAGPIILGRASFQKYRLGDIVVMPAQNWVMRLAGRLFGVRLPTTNTIWRVTDVSNARPGGIVRLEREYG
jgi:hypothetical protein